MSVRLRDTDGIVHIRWIPKYTFLERFGHWVHAATYIPLAFTGFLIFAPLIQGLAQGDWGEALRVTHRLFAVAFGLMPIIYIIFQPRRFVMNLRENFRFGREDIGWIKAAIPYYLMGRHVDMPPQPRFNTGERLNAAAIRRLIVDAGRVDRAVKGALRRDPWLELEALVARLSGIELTRAA